MKRILLKSAAGALALSLALPVGRPLWPRTRSTCRCSPTAPAPSPAPARRSPTACTTISTMLNERDGGIGGVKLAIDECETGYDTKKGVECYEAVKPKNPVIVNPWSTGITLPLIPKASVDKIPILSMAYGLSASASGDIFPWIFNPPATYWDGASEILEISPAAARRHAQGQDDRLSLSRRRLRQGADPAVPGARQGGRLQPRSSIRSRRPTCRTSPRNGSTSAATSRTSW